MKLIQLWRLLIFSALNALGLAVLNSSAAAATLTVINLNDSGAGSLRQAIAAAAPTNDVIVFAPGVTGTITLTSGELYFTKNLTIRGPGATNLTVSGNNTSRVFSVSGGVITISGLRIANGFVTGNPNSLNAGGGIFNNSARLTVQNCEIANNVHAGGPGSGGFPVTGQGGGIWHVSGGDANTGGRLLVQNCLFSSNMAIGGVGPSGAIPNGSGSDAAPAQGGGLFIFGSSANSVTLKDCTFIDNSAIGGTGGNGVGTGTRGRGGRGQGGAVYIGENTVLVAERCTFRRNRATGGIRGAGSNTSDSNFAEGQGGGVYDAGIIVLNDCTLDDNDATGGAGINSTALIGAPGQGGGFYFAGGFVSMNRSTVINNLAEGGAGGTGGGATSKGEGGGLFIRYSGNQFTMNVNNSTIALNFAFPGNAAGSANGGGIWTEDILNLVNSTVAFNLVSSNASGAGGGLRVVGGTTTLRNSLLAENVANSASSDATGAIAPASSHNIIAAAVNVTGVANGTSSNRLGTSAAPIDPKMHAPSFNGGVTRTCSIDAGSPAINTGNNTNAPVVDQRGYLRSGVSDIGAFEFGGSAPFLKILSITRTANGTNVLTGIGVSNGVHRIQASLDLSPGSFFDLPPTVTADGAGLWQYQDGPAGLTKRFYRLAFP